MLATTSDEANGGQPLFAPLPAPDAQAFSHQPACQWFPDLSPTPLTKPYREKPNLRCLALHLLTAQTFWALTILRSLPCRSIQQPQDPHNLAHTFAKSQHHLVCIPPLFPRPPSHHLPRPPTIAPHHVYFHAILHGVPRDKQSLFSTAATSAQSTELPTYPLQSFLR